jgi:kynurenine formamidase
MTQDAARYLAGRGIRLLGMDTPTPGRDWYELHHILLGAEIVVVESLANLGEVPDSFTLSAFPLSFKGLDGSPIRAVAIVEE